MYEMYSHAKLYKSAIISLMEKSGLRLQVMGNPDGTDGLRIRDLQDLMIMMCMRNMSGRRPG